MRRTLTDACGGAAVFVVPLALCDATFGIFDLCPGDMATDDRERPVGEWLGNATDSLAFGEVSGL